MAEVKWIKYSTTTFEDEKIKYIESLPNGDTILIIWHKMLALAGKSNSSGWLMLTDKLPYNEDMLSCIFNKNLKVLQLALNIFTNLEMIEIVDSKIYLTNWLKYQDLEKIEQKKQYDREYQRKKRDMKQISYDNRTIIVEQNNENRSLDKEEEIDKELKEELKSNIKDSLSNSLENNELNSFLEIIETEFKRTLSSTEIDKINYWFDQVGYKYLEHALRETIINRKTSVAYMEAILKDWTKKEITVEMLNQGIRSR